MIGKGLAKTNSNSRRGLLLGLAGLSAVAWGWQRFLHRPVDLSFVPIPGLADWRQTETGTISGRSPTGAVFLGIDEEAPPPLPAERLCDVLYTTPGPGVPIAVFTDAYCPNCRSLEAKLAARKGKVAISWMHLPILRPSSIPAAQIAVAVALLKGTSSVSPMPLRGNKVELAILYRAEREGLDPKALNAKMESSDVGNVLRTHAAAAETLGIWGTPAMTIGNTLVMGGIEQNYRIKFIVSMQLKKSINVVIQLVI